jgi:hypothetical protein
MDVVLWPSIVGSRNVALWSLAHVLTMEVLLLEDVHEAREEAKGIAVEEALPVGIRIGKQIRIVCVHVVIAIPAWWTVDRPAERIVAV